MYRCGWLAACILAVAFPALARTWNDTEGHSVEGEFVRVLKGKVVINVAGRMIQVPFGHLVEDDQDFVREELEKHGLGSQLPARKTSATSDSAAGAKASENDTAAANDPKPGPERTWTDIQGRSIQARFICVEDAKIVLKFKGKRTSFPFDKFSLADQRYVRTEMTGRGEGDKVPAEAAPVNVQPGPVGPQFVQTQPPAMPQTGVPGFRRPMMPVMPRMPEMRFPSMPTPAPVQPAPFQRPQMVAPTFPQRAQPLPMPQMPQFPQPPQVPTFANNQPTSQEGMKQCMHCLKAVPGNLTAGDRCPYCGVYFEVDQTTGKTAHWVYFTTPGGIGAVIGLIIYFVRRRNA